MLSWLAARSTHASAAPFAAPMPMQLKVSAPPQPKSSGEFAARRGLLPLPRRRGGDR